LDDAQDRCVTRLIEALSGRPGISQVHVVGRERLATTRDAAALQLETVACAHSADGCNFVDQRAGDEHADHSAGSRVAAA